MKEERFERLLRENLLNTPEALEALKLVQEHDYLVGVTLGCGLLLFVLVSVFGSIWLINKCV